LERRLLRMLHREPAVVAIANVRVYAEPELIDIERERFLLVTHVQPNHSHTLTSSNLLSLKRLGYIFALETPLLRNCDREVGPLRGVDEADRHMTMLMRRRLCARPDLAWAQPGDVSERAAEGTQALPTGGEGDLGDRPLGVAQQRGRPLDPPRQLVAVRRDAERLFERTREVSLGDAADLCQATHGPLLLRCGVQAILRAHQPAQQFGILEGEVVAHDLSRE